MNFKYLIIAALTLNSFNTNAQTPANYYADTLGLTGFPLKTKLSAIISAGYIDNGYSGLWTGYASTDRDNYYENDGTLLDLYSEKPNGADSYEYTIGANQCGNYNSEADCYNREHVVPQSLFSSASPMKNDIAFVIPTDGWVNGKRSDWPYGIVTNPTWTSTNGSKLGLNTTTGYSGTAFEPINEFKGDVARMTFYFVTRYQSQVPNFTVGNILDGSDTFGLQKWYFEMLLNWHHQDPVSQREKDRNDAIYAYQHNRNPYVDHPEWVDCIWGNTTCGTTIVDTNTTSIEQRMLEAAIVLYPNPSVNQINLSSVSNVFFNLIEIYAMDGRKQKSLIFENDNSNKTSININDLNNGLYYIQIKTSKGNVVRKFVKH